MRFLVTGGAGFVGNHLVKLLVEKGHEVKVVDNLIKGKKENLLDIFDKIEFHSSMYGFRRSYTHFIAFLAFKCFFSFTSYEYW